MGTPLETKVDRPTGRIVQAGPLIIVHYKGPSSPELAVSDFAPSRAAVATYGELSNLVIFEANLVGRPDPRVQEIISKQLLELGPRLRCTGIAVRGTGLAPLVLRTMLSGMSLMSKTATRQKVFKTVPEALAWVQASDGQHAEVRAIDGAALLAALE